MINQEQELARKKTVAANRNIKERDYWMNRLSGTIIKTHFPYDYIPNGINGNHRQQLAFQTNGSIYNRLTRMSNQSDHMLHMILVSGVMALLARYTGNNDIIVGIPVTRQHSQGEYINTILPIRNKFNSHITFKELLLQVRKTILEAVAHQNYPLDILMDRLDVLHPGDGFPLFDVAITLKSIHDDDYIRCFNPAVLFSFARENNLLTATLEYNASLYETTTVQWITNHFNQLLEKVLPNVNAQLAEVDVLSRTEKEQFLMDFNRTEAPYPHNKLIHQLVQEQVDRVPQNSALVYNSQTISFHQLEKDANRLGNYLATNKHIQPDDRVGVLLDNSPHLVTAVLGIQKAGGAFVPLDPILPPERMKIIIDDAGINVIVSQKRHVKLLNRLQWECSDFHTYLCLDTRDIAEEEEVEKSELMDVKLWEYIGESASDDITAGGWVSSYTGDPFTPEEMEEYTNNMEEKLKPILNPRMRVLEIGCASGLSMYRLAPQVAFYYGTDMSQVIIDKNKNRVRKQGLKNIALACIPAHDIHRLQEKPFDLIIMNSVVQSFHGHNYLKQVINKAIHLLAKNGHLFIGDVMDHELKKDLIRDMITFKQVNQGQNYKTKTDWSTELFVSRGFFEDLKAEQPGIQQVECSKKIYTIENELTTYRYDVLLTIDKETPQASPPSNIQSKHKYQEDLRQIDLQPYTPPPTCVSPLHLAYVIYTSGSTGSPKGVMISHHSLVNYLWWAKKQYVKKNPCTFPLYTSAAFDLTITSIYLPLITGNTLKIYDYGEKNRMPIHDVIKENAVDIIKTTPSHLKIIQNTPVTNSRIKTFIIGGEILETSLARTIHEQFSGSAILYNEYGPTEATVGCMIFQYDCKRDNRKSVPIGTPIDNLRIYVLDKRQNPLPINAAGEIYISGQGIARGYLNKPELTAEKFCLRRPRGTLFEKTAPLDPPQKLLINRSYVYRTGDRGRMLPTREIEFLGRIDQQVKIRGFRIELGEIENKLLNYSKTSPQQGLPQKIEDGKQVEVSFPCPRCALPASFPDMQYDEKGVCNTCREYEDYKEKSLDYFKPTADFHSLMTEAREANANNSRYDCLLLFSGGKDSSYVLYRLVEMGYKVLAFTFDNGYISKSAFENIKRITSALNVDSIIARTPRMNKIFVESLITYHDVCNGCFKAVNTLGTQLAMEKGINVIVTGVSRGQIFDIKLHGLFRMGIFTESEIEEKQLMFRKSYHAMNNKISQLLDIELTENNLENIYFVDFFKYDHTPVNQVREFLGSRDQRWNQPEDTGFCSTNCIINDVGIYVHLKEKGYHNYAAQLSWDCRLGLISREIAIKELTFNGNFDKIQRILNEIGYYDSIPIENAIVTNRQDEKGENYLCAYLAARKEIDKADLRRYLAAELPDYMIPAYFVTLDRIPLSTNGKVDYKALPDPRQTYEPGQTYEAPDNEIQEQIIAIWAEVLGLDAYKIGIADDFFSLGGNSFTILQVKNLLDREFDLDISLSSLFMHTTVKALAANIFEKSILDNLECIVKLNNGNSQRNLFIIHPLHGMVYQYKELAELLQEHFTVYGIQSRGVVKKSRLAKNGEDILYDYLLQILSVQKQGPYFIAGFCMGATLAYELTRMLEDLGHIVEKAILFDETVFIPDPYIQFLRSEERKRDAINRFPPFLRKFFKIFLKIPYDPDEVKNNLSHRTLDYPRDESLPDDLEQRKQMIDRNNNEILLKKIRLKRFIKSSLLITKALERENPTGVTLRYDIDIWRQMTQSDVTLIETHGDHETIFKEPHVTHLAKAVINNTVKNME